MTRISAIITTYNVEAFIATAMQSVIDTGFDDLELIVVDDGSTDATRQVADVIGAAAPSDRVRYVPIYFSRNTPGGVASAANAGLDRASGEVVIFVDGDDWVLPNMLRRAVDLHLAEAADVTVCGCKEYWNDSGAFTQYPEGHVWATLPEAGSLSAKREAVLRLAPFPWRKIYSRDFLERHSIRFPVGDFFYEDNPFHWATTLRAERFVFFRPVTHVHRMARAGQTVMNMGLKPLKIFDHAETIRGHLMATGQDAAMRARYLHWLIEHVLWCCRYVPAHGLNQVFNRAQADLAELPEDEFWALLGEHPRNHVGIRRLTAIYLNDRMGFLREF
ncbi:glycosyltransferase family 2 protein [Antarcticimicrobium sediminis]|uniref:Glycosyltransferase family 2 protein n=1 Tax=Antarcticimicrobium sediminis TaxID=2546227 RepID=A0A4R5EIP1_9RHOB|nr:glycosyltransferase family 2 protein [Antarcticimicrobium sediminis]TDE34254.1 glycosyltransferase family 2 protein [Antarcticimicrobium sediminis]